MVWTAPVPRNLSVGIVAKRRSFIGTEAAYQSYLGMLRQPLQQADDVSPDYRSQANALLNGTPVWMDTLQAQDPQTLTDYFKELR